MQPALSRHLPSRPPSARRQASGGRTPVPAKIGHTRETIDRERVDEHATDVLPPGRGRGTVVLDVIREGTGLAGLALWAWACLRLLGGL